MSIQSALGFFQAVPGVDPKFPQALLGFQGFDDLVDFGRKAGFDFDVDDLRSLESAIESISGGASPSQAAITSIIGAVGAAAAAGLGGLGTASLVLGILNANQ